MIKAIKSLSLAKKKKRELDLKNKQRQDEIAASRNGAKFPYGSDETPTVSNLTLCYVMQTNLSSYRNRSAHCLNGHQEVMSHRDGHSR